MNTEKNRISQVKRNIKYNRKRTFMKKAFEFSQICGEEIIIFLYNRNIN